MKSPKKTSQAVERLDSVIFYGFQILLLLIFFVFSNNDDGFTLPKALILWSGTITLFTLWVAQQLFSKRPGIRRTSLDVPVISFFFFCVVATLFSMHPIVSLLGKYHRHRGLLSLISYALLFFLGAQIYRNVDRLLLHFKIIAVAATLISIYGLLQFIGIDFAKWVVATSLVAFQSTSTFGNRSFLAGFLVLVLPMVFVLFLSEPRARRFWIYGCFLLIIFAAFLTSFTRGAWIGGLLGFFLLVLLAGKELIRQKYHLLFLALCSLLIIIVLLISSGAQFTGKIMDLASRVTSIGEIVKGTAAIRIEIWKSALSIIAARPLTGTGPDVFQLLFPRYQSVKFIQLTPWQAIADDAHNHSLHIMATLGLPAFLIYATIILVFFWKGIIFVRRHTQPKSTKSNLLYAALLSSILGYLVHLQFEPSDVTTVAYFWAVLGMASSLMLPAGAIDLSKQKLFFRQRFVVIFVLVLACVSVIGLSSYIYLANMHFSEARRLFNSQNLSGAAAEYKEAARLNFYCDRYQNELASAYLEISKSTGSEEDFVKAIDTLTKAQRMNPLNADNYLLLAEAYIYGGGKYNRSYYDLAFEASKKALELQPQSALAHYFLGNIYASKGELDKAIPHLKSALRIRPDFSDSQILLKRIEEVKDQKDGT